MTKINILKLLGLLSALATGGTLIFQGDPVSGGGIIAAALASASALKSPS